MNILAQSNAMFRAILVVQVLSQNPGKTIIHGRPESGPVHPCRANRHDALHRHLRQDIGWRLATQGDGAVVIGVLICLVVQADWNVRLALGLRNDLH